ncbi:MAG: hypothetical protein QG602_1251 [Verrucomicrobiota bacterium]|nr:hypothetical protein [Verrucomicrobiota bacterium]
MAVAALAPWWHNRTHLRSFFDYGLVVAGAGRIEAGQKPYVDFISPAQAGWYFWNWAAEQVAGGTFQAMTTGGAASIVVSLAVLCWILMRRWPWPAAVLVATGLVCMTVSQHTLLWYNPWGVVWLVVAAWTGAVAPVLRREDWPWHALAAAAFFFGGVNKVNMQLMALGLAMAWAVRAGLTGRAAWARVALTTLFYAVCVVLPVLIEMAWTGASFAAWWHSVITLPAASRSGMAFKAFAPEYLFTPFNHHYPGVVLLQAGLVGVVLTLLTLTAILRKTWREAGWWEKVLPILCAGTAYVGGVVLMATNMDIVFIAFGGWLGLLVALWLGYGLPARGPWFYGTLVGPAVVVGAVAWYSAWQGNRSQFGHSASHRDAYVAAETAGSDFAYLRGTLMPPETVESLKQMARWRQSLSPERKAGHFFGPGTEWAAHIWPALHTPGLPISIYRQPGNSDGQAEMARLMAALSGGTFKEITVAGVADNWDYYQRMVLDHRYEKIHLGEVYHVYSFNEGENVSGSPIWFKRRFGGNVDSRGIDSSAQFMEADGARMFLGVVEAQGMMQVKIPSNRLQGEVLVRRLEGAPKVSAQAEFVIYAQNAKARYERWRQKVELAADQHEAVVPYAIDSSGFPTTFTVEIPPEHQGVIAAGWRGPQINHVGVGWRTDPVWFSRGKSAAVPLDESALAALLPDAWRPEEAYMRNGRVTAQGVELLPGGEIWLKTRGFVTEFVGQGKVESDWNSSAVPRLRAMWYKAGRLEVCSDKEARENDHAVDFRSWCSEGDGWLIIAVDSTVNAPAIRVRVNKVTPRPSNPE